MGRLLTTLKPAQMARKLKRTLKVLARENARNFIRQNWRGMNDTAIGSALGLRSATVCGLRRELGLHRSREGIADAIDWNDLRCAVVDGGQTLSEYHREKGLKITFERLRQLCAKRGIYGRLKGLGWYANRMGNPNLMRKEFVEHLLVTHGSLSRAAEAIGVRRDELERQVARLGVIVPQRNHKVELVCANPKCKRKFTVSLRVAHKRLQARRKHNPTISDDLNQLFCSRRCHSRSLSFGSRPQPE
jgi:hypothetical protein